MTPILEDAWLTVYGGDNREVMRTLPDESVQCVVTSPPYWGLRDYGTASWDGGDPDHDHIGSDLRTADDGGPKQQTKRGSIGVRSGDCKCGAIRQDRQLGLEQTPEEYVAAMVDVFREVRRVLRKDGTLWLNLGDSYASDMKGSGGAGKSTLGPNRDLQNIDFQKMAPVRLVHGLKPKDLVGIPWRVAFALQADGWYLRSDVIWAKPNPMPESVTDRPTKSHEYLFLLSKSATYHYDADAVREGLADTNAQRTTARYDTTGRGPRDGGNGGLDALAARMRNGEHAGRNRRSVWTIATKPYPGTHFATFPEALVEPCILAGTSEAGACATCGSPWQRVVERSNPRLTDPAYTQRDATPKMANATAAVRRNDYGTTATGLAKPGWRELPPASSTTTGFRPTCSHDGPTVPCVVLDPFAGTGTVGAVAQRLSRRALLIDLNPDYLRQCLTRNQQAPLGLGA